MRQTCSQYVSSQARSIQQNLEPCHSNTSHSSQAHDQWYGMSWHNALAVSLPPIIIVILKRKLFCFGATDSKIESSECNDFLSIVESTAKQGGILHNIDKYSLLNSFIDASIHIGRLACPSFAAILEVFHKGILVYTVTYVQHSGIVQFFLNSVQQFCIFSPQ